MSVIEDEDGVAHWPTVTLEMVEAAAAVRRLYRLEGCAVGGPLHVEVDDFNLDDHFLERSGLARTIRWLRTGVHPEDEWRNLEPSPYPIADVIHFYRTARRLRRLPEPERYVAVAIAHGMVPELDADVEQFGVDLGPEPYARYVPQPTGSWASASPTNGGRARE